MPATSSAVDRHPVPTVAIVGNDAVLAAAPATPVQLVHACLRRGFTVAVPASWGDELIATDAIRQLAARERGPAVMCVCPYVRSRLLGPGPDLAPFLVSLVSPPVAAARYLRLAYGAHDVHITYIGGCPGADDPSVDARLTPDDFLADLAERGIALSEQPLVFDSIVPPDRRRWSSAPGGVPGTEALWNETDTRTLIEIDRDDASTNLAQHIITREHVLLDLAPSLGCACSGAVGSLAPRGSRAAVTALEPPRALGPIIDPAIVVPLDAPVIRPSARTAVAEVVAPPLVELADTAMERVLDELLGVDDSMVAEPGVVDDAGGNLDSDLATTITVDEPLILDSVWADASRLTWSSNAEPATVAPSGPPQPSVGEPSTEVSHDPSQYVLLDLADDVPARAPDAVAEVTNGTGAPVAMVVDESPAPTPDAAIQNEPAPIDHSVRRRTPPTTHARYSPTQIPKAMGADGRPLPRAYVAKRRTPPGGAAIISNAQSSTTDTWPASAEQAPGEVVAATHPAPPVSSPTTPLEVEVAVPVSAEVSPPDSAMSAHAASADDTVDAAVPVLPEPAPVAPSPADTAPPSTLGAPKPAPPSSTSPPEASRPADGERAAAAAAAAGDHGAFMFLLVAVLVALGAFVLFSLRR